MHQGARDMPLPAVHGSAGGSLLRGVQAVRQPVSEGEKGQAMTAIFDREDERRELRKLIDHYQQRADKYEYEYQLDGMPSQERAWMRNERMADALRLALDGSSVLDRYHDLRWRVMELDTGDADKLVKQVDYLQKRLMEGDEA